MQGKGQNTGKFIYTDLGKCLASGKDKSAYTEVQGMRAKAPTTLAIEPKPAVVSQLQPDKGKQSGDGEAPLVGLKDVQILTFPQWGLRVS